MISQTSVPPVSTQAFASLPLFRGVEGIILKNLATASRLAQHEKGAVFLTQGQPVNHSYIVLEGWCGASKGNLEGHESILQIFRQGDVLPEPEISPTPQSATLNLVALTPARLLSLPLTALRSALDQSPALASNMLAASFQRCQSLRDHIEQLTLHNAEQRVGHFLLQIRFDTSACLSINLCWLPIWGSNRKHFRAFCSSSRKMALPLIVTI